MSEEVKVDNINKAISVLIQGVTIGQTKGIFSFQESKIIAEALEFLDKLNTKKTEGD